MTTEVSSYIIFRNTYISQAALPFVLNIETIKIVRKRSQLGAAVFNSNSLWLDRKLACTDRRI